MGQASSLIAVEMGLTLPRISIIINSPLFKQELRRRMLKKEERILELEESLLDGAKMGVETYKEILSSVIPHPTALRMQAANSVTSLALRMLSITNPPQPTNGSQPSKDNDEPLSYEERLKKVTIEESVRTVTQLPSSDKQPTKEIEELLKAEYPPEELLLSETQEAEMDEA